MENEDDIEYEQYIPEYPLELNIKGIEEIKQQMQKSICKIFLEENKVGTGFFLKFYIKNTNKTVKALVTNNHIINEKELNKKIIISLNNQKEFKYLKEIKLNSSRRIFTDPNLDITIIELKNEAFNSLNFLELDDNFEKEKKYLNHIYKKKPIYIVHYPKDKEVCSSFGLLKEINEKNEIYHYCCTDNGSSGSPILSLETKKVIGIHKSSEKKRQFNIGTLLCDIQKSYFLYLNDINKEFVYSKNLVKNPNMNTLKSSRNNSIINKNPTILGTNSKKINKYHNILNNINTKMRTDKINDFTKKGLNKEISQKNNYEKNIKAYNNKNTSKSKNNKINYNTNFHKSINKNKENKNNDIINNNNFKIPSFEDDDYKYIECIGEGSFGKVFSVIENKTGKEYAL